MLPLSQRIAFALFAIVTVALGFRAFLRMFLRIRRGRGDTDDRTGRVAQRAFYALWTTLTQARVFRRRRVLSVLHSFIFYAFVLYLLVNAVDAAEGFMDFGELSHSPVGVAYRALTDFFSVAAILAVLLFVLRRYALPGRRDFAFNPRTLLHPDIRAGYIARDSAIVSAFIVIHIGSRVIGNAAMLAMRGPDPAQPFASLLAPLLAGPHALAWRVFGYWGALGSVLLFLVYFPHSKHVHLLMAPVKYFFHRGASSGELPALKVDLDAPAPELGAATLPELTWPRLLDSYACVQCNRCQDVCPASATGKALSPAALEINKRMVLNTIARQASPFSLTGSAFEAGAAPGPELLDAVISPEAVWACTTCGACMEVCPTQDEQMLDIIDIRRNLVLQQGDFPAQLQTAFRGMERTRNPWGIAQDKRMAWADGLNVPTVDEVSSPDVLYWVGCAASYDPAAQKTARAVVQLLQKGNVNFAVLGKRETCTGDSARRAGNELLFQELAGAAISTLQQVRPKQIIASCPHCVNTIGNEFPQLGGNFSVVHHTEFLASMLDREQLKAAPSKDAIAFHDPCYLGRHRGTYDQPRNILRVLSNDVVELGRNRSNAFCCGAGGAQFWKEEEPGDERISENRFREAQAALASPADGGGKLLAVGCPFCKSMLQSTPSAGDDATIVIKDVAELLWEGVQRANPVSSLPPRPSEVVTARLPYVEMHAADGVPVQLLNPPARAEALTPIAAAKTGPSSQLKGEPTPTGVPPPVSPRTPADPAARKKWTPTARPAAPSVAASSGPVASTAGPASEVQRAVVPEAVTPAARRRWQPKASPESAAAQPPAKPSDAGSAPSDRVGATQASDESAAPVTRKKWQPPSRG